MKLILLKDNTGKAHSLSMDGGKLLALLIVAVLILPATVGLGSYWLTKRVTSNSLEFASDDTSKLHFALLQQREQLDQTQEYVKNHLNVLGIRMGSLQAQVSRINAVEQRLAEAANVDLTDFDFSSTPAQGSGEADVDDLSELELKEAMSELEAELRAREAEMQSLAMALSAITLKNDQTPSGMPVQRGWVSSPFGYRNSPIHGGRQFHKGVDIPGKSGEDVLAVADGVVLRAGRSGNYGLLVEVNHGDGYTTLYAHNKKNLVKPGQPVKKGEPIALLGSTGRSTGPHVHFEVRKNGRPVNPSKYIF